MTDPISGIGGKALSAIKPEQKKDEPVKGAEPDAQATSAAPKASDEVLTQIKADKSKNKGKIVDVIEKGYMLGDKILRYPKVVVAN